MARPITSRATRKNPCIEKRVKNASRRSTIAFAAPSGKLAGGTEHAQTGNRDEDGQRQAEQPEAAARLGPGPVHDHRERE